MKLAIAPGGDLHGDGVCGERQKNESKTGNSKEQN